MLAAGAVTTLRLRTPSSHMLRRRRFTRPSCVRRRSSSSNPIRSSWHQLMSSDMRLSSRSRPTFGRARQTVAVRLRFLCREELALALASSRVTSTNSPLSSADRR